MEITSEIAVKVIQTVDAGLVAGIGEPIPGNMCVEAAVCHALGLPHDDDPGCGAQSLRKLKIILNDACWSSPVTRAKGLRKLAVLQLGSLGVLDEVAFIKRCVELATGKYVPMVLRAAAKVHPDKGHQLALKRAARKCELEETIQAAQIAQAAYWAANWAACWAGEAAYWAAKAVGPTYWTARAAYWAIEAARTANDPDKVLAEFAEEVSQILIDMQVPGVQWLSLLT